METVVIAEAGSCHDNSLARAFELIDVAVSSGARFFKVQYWSNPERLSERRNAPDLAGMYERYRLPYAWLQPLAERCQAAGIEFACSTFLPEDVDVVAPYVSLLKVASLEANDPALLVAHAPHLRAGKTVVVSLGAGARLRPVLHYMLGPDHSGYEYEQKDLNGRLVFLHCVSAYPVPPQQMQLKVLRNLCGQQYKNGLSDHSASGNTLTGALAVVFGARYIERHIRLDATREENPDFGHSMPPGAFKQYCYNIILAEDMVWTDSGADVQPCERGMLKHRVGVDLEEGTGKEAANGPHQAG